MDNLCNQICTSCANKFEAKMPKGHICGWWSGECEACGDIKTVTSIRDFNYPKIEKGIYKNENA